MTLVLVYLAVLGIVAARWLARQQLAAKSWVGAGPPLAPTLRDPAAPARLGLKVFLAAVGLLFSLLIAAYDMRVPGGVTRILIDPRLLWLTTAALVAASVALHRAGAAVRSGDPAEARAALRVAMTGGFMFLAGQALAWRLLWQAGAIRTSDAAGSFFCLITALHGLHLAGGLAAIARTLRHAAKAAPPLYLREGIDLCTLYWDALLAIWLVVFGLLFRTPWSGLVDIICRPA
jgi:cytochrome c oxidase subunit 3